MNMSQLDNYSKKNPFIIPDGYFNELPERIKQKMESENSKRDKKWKIISLKPYIAVAAGFLLVFSLWHILFKQMEKIEITKNIPVIENPENLYFESTNNTELIEMIVSIEMQGEFNLPDVSSDDELILEQIEESEIIDAI